MAITSYPDYNNPQPTAKPLATNYMSLYDFTTKYIPDYLPTLVPRYNNGITGFLDAFGHRIPVGADRIYVAESGRLLPKLMNVSLSGTDFTADESVKEVPLKVGQKILVSNPASGGKYGVGYVESVDGNTFSALPYASDSWSLGGNSGLIVLCVGSDFAKGTDKIEGALESQEDIYSFSLHISKGGFAMNASDVTAPTWYKTPDGGMVWSNQWTEDEYKRFLNQKELDFFLSENVVNTTLADAGLNSGQGIFAMIRERGTTFTGVPTTLEDFEELVKLIDKVQGESYNGLFITTEMSLAIDNMLAHENRYTSDGKNWGAFRNAENALTFGFDSFTIGGKTFYKATWNMLTDPTALATENFSEESAIHGIMMPMGSVSVKSGYNSSLSGAEVKSVDYLNILYRAGNGYDRSLISTPYGVGVPGDTRDVVGVAWTSEEGAMMVCPNRWAIFEGKSE